MRGRGQQRDEHALGLAPRPRWPRAAMARTTSPAPSEGQPRTSVRDGGVNSSSLNARRAAASSTVAIISPDAVM